jgi:hypothetical protein
MKVSVRVNSLIGGGETAFSYITKCPLLFPIAGCNPTKAGKQYRNQQQQLRSITGIEDGHPQKTNQQKTTTIAKRIMPIQIHVPHHLVVFYWYFMLLPIVFSNYARWVRFQENSMTPAFCTAYLVFCIIGLVAYAFVGGPLIVMSYKYSTTARQRQVRFHWALGVLFVFFSTPLTFLDLAAIYTLGIDSLIQGVSFFLNGVGWIFGCWVTWFIYRLEASTFIHERRGGGRPLMFQGQRHAMAVGQLGAVGAAAGGLDARLPPPLSSRQLEMAEMHNEAFEREMRERHGFAMGLEHNNGGAGGMMPPVVPLPPLDAHGADGGYGGPHGGYSSAGEDGEGYSDQDGADDETRGLSPPQSATRWGRGGVGPAVPPPPQGPPPQGPGAYFYSGAGAEPISRNTMPRFSAGLSSGGSANPLPAMASGGGGFVYGRRGPSPGAFSSGVSPHARGGSEVRFRGNPGGPPAQI